MNFISSSVATTVDFANQSYYLQPSVLKSSISVAYWPFLSLKNQLQIVYELGTDQKTWSNSCSVTAPKVDTAGIERNAKFSVTNN